MIPKKINDTIMLFIAKNAAEECKSLLNAAIAYATQQNTIKNFEAQKNKFVTSMKKNQNNNLQKFLLFFEGELMTENDCNQLCQFLLLPITIIKNSSSKAEAHIVDNKQESFLSFYTEKSWWIEKIIAYIQNETSQLIEQQTKNIAKMCLFLQKPTVHDFEFLQHCYTIDADFFNTTSYLKIWLCFEKEHQENLKVFEPQNLWPLDIPYDKNAENIDTYLDHLTLFFLTKLSKDNRFINYLNSLEIYPQLLMEVIMATQLKKKPGEIKDTDRFLVVDFLTRCNFSILQKLTKPQVLQLINNFVTDDFSKKDFLITLKFSSQKNVLLVPENNQNANIASSTQSTWQALAFSQSNNEVTMALPLVSLTLNQSCNYSSLFSAAMWNTNVLNYLYARHPYNRIAVASTVTTPSVSSSVSNAPNAIACSEFNKFCREKNFFKPVKKLKNPSSRDVNIETNEPPKKQKKKL